MKNQLESLKGDGIMKPSDPSAEMNEVDEMDIKSEDVNASSASNTGSAGEDVVKELKKLERQNRITHLLLSGLIVLTVVWQVSEVSLLLKVKNGLTHPFKSVGSMVTRALKRPKEVIQDAETQPSTKQNENENNTIFPNMDISGVIMKEQQWFNVLHWAWMRAMMFGFDMNFSDWVATIALGAISNRLQEKPNNSLGDDLASFWAPFLLLHIGGPDVITAYSLEDNELWQRKLLELVTQTIVALYIFLLALPGITSLSLLTIPMLIAGVIKFGERIYSLRSASMEQFRLSLMTEPDPGPNYPKFMEEFTLKKAEGFYVTADEVNEAPLPTSLSTSVKDKDLVLKAHDFFQTFKRLFVDLILSYQDRDNSRSFFQKLKSEKAFEVIKIELGFAYDVFYTKAPIVYKPTGYILRLFTFFATLISLLVFVWRRDNYDTIDLIITYLLLVVAIVLEIYALLLLLFSDWTDYWLRRHYRKRHLSLPKPSLWGSRQRWSNLIAQHSMLNVCLEEKSSLFACAQKLFMVDDVLKKIHCTTYSEVSDDLKSFIFEHFLKISQTGNKNELTARCRSRGMCALQEYSSALNWSEVEFDQGLLLWHIATELCYYSDTIRTPEDREEVRIGSKNMSDYMLYLLVMCPFMLPIGIGMIRFLDTCAEAREFFKERREEPDKPEACRMLLRVNTEVLPAKVKGDRSKSVLFDACRVATELRAMESKDQINKWEIICKGWIEILAYAACQCRGTHHARQLRKGGEFLTHVWLLMAHLGITDQFQIWQGHARAKLSAK